MSANTTMAKAAPGRLSGPKKLLQARESGVFAVLVLLFLIGSVASPSFIQGDNLLSVGQQISQIGIMAVGATFVIINGEIDLSVGSIYALGAIVTGMAIDSGIAWPLAIVFGLLAGTLAGADDVVTNNPRLDDTTYTIRFPGQSSPRGPMPDVLGELAAKAKVIVRTGAFEPWGNIGLRCGVDIPKWFNGDGVIAPHTTPTDSTRP